MAPHILQGINKEWIESVKRRGRTGNVHVQVSTKNELKGETFRVIQLISLLTVSTKNELKAGISLSVLQVV